MPEQVLSPGVPRLLEGIALAATKPLRQAPIGTAPGECETHHGIGCEAIVEATSKADCPRGQVMAADHSKIAGRAIAAAITSTPHRPARLVDRYRLLRGLEHRRIGERDVR